MTFQATLINPQQAHQVLSEIWPKVKAYVMGGNRLHLEIKKETRSSEQNRLMWAALTDISRQVEWHGMRLSPEDWKNLITASVTKQRLVPGLDGGFVALGQSTSKMSIAEMTEVIECALAFGAQHGVEFGDQQ